MFHFQKARQTNRSTAVQQQLEAAVSVSQTGIFLGEHQFTFLGGAGGGGVGGGGLGAADIACTVFRCKVSDIPGP